MTAEVIVLVIEAMRTWVPPAGAVRAPRSVVPTAFVNRPWGVRTSTRVPGIISSAAVASTVARNAAGSIVFSTDDPPGVVAAAPAAGAAAPPDEQPASTRTREAVSPAARMIPRPRRNGDRRVPASMSCSPQQGPTSLPDSPS